MFDDIKSRARCRREQFLEVPGARSGDLERTWKSLKEVMAPGALDPLTKEMVYLAVSVTNGCGYCIASQARRRARPA